MKNKIIALPLALAVVLFAGCSANTASDDTSCDVEAVGNPATSSSMEPEQAYTASADEPDELDMEPPLIRPGETAMERVTSCAAADIT